MTISEQFLKDFVLERNYKMIFYAFVKIGTKKIGILLVMNFSFS